MLTRLATGTIKDRLEKYPAVALIGPRQAGKTTLARSLGGTYFDLEQGAERLRLDLEWDPLVSGRRLVILDEAQAAPEFFPRLRGAIDDDRKRNGRFLLLGSVSPALMTAVSESLAGRLALVELTPLLLSELANTPQRDRLWLTGGFPDGGVLGGSTFPTWQSDYATLLVQRDLPTWGMPARPATTLRLVKMLAALHGQLWNAAQLGRSLGLSYHTVNTYVDFLAGAFLVRRLSPFHANLKKRLAKSAKVYWRDTGLLHALLNVPDEKTLLEQPWVGSSWEGFVIEQVLGQLEALGREYDAYHLRTSDGREIDLVLDLGGERWAIEVKLTTSPSGEDMRRLDELAGAIRANRVYLISRTRRPAGDDRRASANLAWLLERLR